MTDHASKIRQLITDSKSHADAIHEISQIFERLPEGQAPDVLVEASRGLTPEVLGYLVFPALREKLRADDAFFIQLVSLAPSQRVERDLRGVLLDFLDDAARARGQRRLNPYYNALRQLATTTSFSAEERAKAGRLLARDTSTEAVKTIRLLIDSGERPLVDAAAHVLTFWSHQRVPGAQTLAARLVQYAETHPQDALHSSGIMRALAVIGSRSATSALRVLARSASKPEDRDRLLAAAGAEMEPRLLAQLIRQVMVAPSAEAEWILRGIFTSSPSSLRGLHKTRAHREYLYGLQLAPEAEDFDGRGRIAKLIQSTKKPVAEAARVVLGRQPINPIGVAVPLPTETLIPGEPPLATGFETGFQLGDALYRDLLTRVGNAQHWHDGVFLGFSATTDGTGTLLGIHAANGIGWSDAITYFSAAKSFSSPAANMATFMYDLRRDFLQAFADGHVNHPFHGARSTPGINRWDRKKIAVTASTFYGKNIWWTWVDMLDYKGTGWDGTVEDIDETRCDGVIEYCYEKQGLRVCGGKDPDHRNQWNIALPGKNHPENHEDFHNHAYNPGELCPRIQAGDQANDTTFVVPPAVRPTIDYFNAFPFLYFFAPMISFKVSASASYRVYARVVVRKKDERTFHFAQTEDPYGGIGTPVGDWRLMETDLSTMAFWLGKTTDGPDYRGQNGAFEFRLQVIDQGGNVSDEHAVEVTIAWP
jgi:hypothetical protein